MHSPKVYLYVFDTMSDWETGYVTAELNSGRYFKKGLAPLKVIHVGPDNHPVTTMGGLRIVTDISIEECVLTSADVFILPGGNTWTEEIHDPVLKIVTEALEAGTVIAAICGATLGLARAGLLDSRRHTSNDLGYMKMVCPDYRGEGYYEMEPAVTDKNMVTASGVAPLEFAVQILKVLDVFAPETLHAWYKLNETRKPEYFYELMKSIT